LSVDMRLGNRASDATRYGVSRSWSCSLPTPRRLK
jgi:hypothetical protein